MTPASLCPRVPAHLQTIHGHVQSLHDRFGRSWSHPRLSGFPAVWYAEVIAGRVRNGERPTGGHASPEAMIREEWRP